jgi:hypothetical protein
VQGHLTAAQQHTVNAPGLAWLLQQLLQAVNVHAQGATRHGHLCQAEKR